MTYEKLIENLKSEEFQAELSRVCQTLMIETVAGEVGDLLREAQQLHELTSKTARAIQQASAMMAMINGGGDGEFLRLMKLSVQATWVQAYMTGYLHAQERCDGKAVKKQAEHLGFELVPKTGAVCKNCHEPIMFTSKGQWIHQREFDTNRTCVKGAKPVLAGVED